MVAVGALLLRDISRGLAVSRRMRACVFDNTRVQFHLGCGDGDVDHFRMCSQTRPRFPPQSLRILGSPRLLISTVLFAFFAGIGGDARFLTRDWITAALRSASGQKLPVAKGWPRCAIRAERNCCLSLTALKLKPSSAGGPRT